MNRPLLDARGLVKRYGGLLATDHLDFELASGEVCGVIGPNGAGKSTLVSLLGGALRPSEGTIHFAGLDVTRMDAPGRARAGIGRTYQIPRPFLDMTVQENLQVAQAALGPAHGRGEMRDERMAILSQCRLADQANQPARALPLLRRKRLEVARALALRPKLLLLDEVGAGLVDSEVTDLIGLVRSLAIPGRSIVIIEHVIRVVRECCGRLVVLNFGRQVAAGRTEEVLADDTVAAIYLGTAHGKTAPAQPVCAAPLDRLVAATVAKQPDALLTLEGVSAGYGQARVLHDLSLSARPGQVVAILGVNGAGKTTLANTIAGSVTPTAGRLLFDGQDITVVPPHLRAAQGMAHCMEGRRIFARLSVEENLTLAARRLTKAERKVRLAQAYALFPDLEQRSSAPGNAMSGGQQQMLAIARALMSRPRLVVFDEISLGLSPVMMDRLYAALAALKAANLTMVVIEQDVDRALALADQVHVLERGSFALSGSAAEVRADPRLRHLYIGAPD